MSTIVHKHIKHMKYLCNPSINSLNNSFIEKLKYYRFSNKNKRNLSQIIYHKKFNEKLQLKSSLSKYSLTPLQNSKREFQTIDSRFIPRIGMNYFTIPKSSILTILFNGKCLTCSQNSLSQIYEIGESLDLKDKDSKFISNHIIELNVPQWIFPSPLRDTSMNFPTILIISHWEGKELYKEESDLNNQDTQFWMEVNIQIVDYINLNHKKVNNIEKDTFDSFFERRKILQQNYLISNFIHLDTIHDLKVFREKINSEFSKGAFILDPITEILHEFNILQYKSNHLDSLISNNGIAIPFITNSENTENSENTVNTENTKNTKNTKNNILKYLETALEERFESLINQLSLKQKQSLIENTYNQSGNDLYWTLDIRKEIASLLQMNISQVSRTILRLKKRENTNSNTTSFIQNQNTNKNHTFFLKKWLEENNYRNPTPKEMDQFIINLEISRKKCLRSLTYLKDRKINNYKRRNTSNISSNSKHLKISRIGVLTNKKKLAISQFIQSQLKKGSIQISNKMLEELSSTIQYPIENVRRLIHHLIDKLNRNEISKDSNEYKNASKLVSDWIKHNGSRPKGIDFALLLESTKLTRNQLHHMISHIIQSKGKNEFTLEKKQKLLKWKNEFANDKSRLTLDEVIPLSHEFGLSPKQIIDFFSYHYKSIKPITNKARELIASIVQENSWQRLNKTQLDYIEKETDLNRKQIHGIVSRLLLKKNKDEKLFTNTN